MTAIGRTFRATLLAAVVTLVTGAEPALAQTKPTEEQILER